ncbi:hypothetical protein FACS189491_00550 [Spirochaetia bacterium]|nr:hypothetical protein FACS189491_00550 [Spirochaetia bacterium]
MLKVMKLALSFFLYIVILSCNKKIETNGTVTQKQEQKIINNEIEMVTEKLIREDDQIYGVYEIKSAYSLIHNQPMLKIDTDKLGHILTINNGIAVFENIQYHFFDNLIEKIAFDNSMSSFSDENKLAYTRFQILWIGMNYSKFDENIIGKDYNGEVLLRSMESNGKSYILFFANNKTIILASKEPEFEYLREWKEDEFFYIAEKIR